MKQRFYYLRKMKSLISNQAIFTFVLALLTVMPLTAQTRKKSTVARRPVATAKKPAQSTSVSKPKLVDLGLPSGTKWADRNLGAASMTAIGNYYAFCETEPKQTFMPDNYTGDQNTTNVAGTDRDAATKKYGTGWSIPTKQQFEELFENCEQATATINGTFVIKLTGPNGNCIYLPAPMNGNWVKMGNAAITKQLNDAFKNVMENFDYLKQFRAAASRGTGGVVKYGLAMYRTANNVMAWYFAFYGKDNKTAQGKSVITPKYEDGKNFSIAGLPIRPVFKASESTDSSDNGGTLELPE